MRLPDTDGETLLKEFSNNEDLRDIPVQIISGYELKKDIHKMGTLGFLQKPVSHRDLKKVFEKVKKSSNENINSILVVEDDKVERIHLSYILLRNNYTGTRFSPSFLA